MSFAAFANLALNRMPAITWHRFKINEADVQLPELAPAPQRAISVQVPDALVQDAAAFDAALDAAPAAREQWETGMGEAGNAWLASAATQRVCVVAPAGVQGGQAAVVRVNAHDGAAAVVALDVVAQAGANVRLSVHVDSPQPGTGVAGVVTRVFAGEGASVEIEYVQTLDGTWQHLDDFGAYLADAASLKVWQTVLGAAESYTGLAVNLAGRESLAAVDTRYLGHGSSKTDFNYIMRQRGAQSTCTLTANGVLMDTASKVLRGTIDLVKGAKGAVGQENETVLLVNDDVRNKTVPILLCDEDDVQGAHGATIGHVNPEQLGYMQTRGLTAEQVEDLFAVASFDYAAAHAFDATTRQSVERLGQAVLGAAFASFAEGE